MSPTTTTFLLCLLLTGTLAMARFGHKNKATVPRRRGLYDRSAKYDDDEDYSMMNGMMPPSTTARTGIAITSNHPKKTTGCDRRHEKKASSTTVEVAKQDDDDDNNDVEHPDTSRSSANATLKHSLAIGKQVKVRNQHRTDDDEEYDDEWNFSTSKFSQGRASETVPRGIQSCSKIHPWVDCNSSKARCYAPHCRPSSTSTRATDNDDDDGDEEDWLPTESSTVRFHDADEDRTSFATCTAASMSTAATPSLLVQHEHPAIHPTNGIVPQDNVTTIEESECDAGAMRFYESITVTEGLCAIVSS